ncbi:LPXTG cell wall anchor domain-containing protein [Streptomyces sp. NPDC048604]|uniref:LPXTG cell wall anchor domain-containing protein n=1 Tax=Streptomyces sp. NPDC048604 TaxID=3365578 RepID=UPI00371BE07C
MKIRRMLATAVAAAVTTPVVLLSAAPAFADTKPAATQQEQQKPTVEELERRVAVAQKAYDAAVAALAKATAAREAAVKDDAPLAKAVEEAKKAADTAYAAWKAAEAKQAEAEAALKALPDTATPEERAAAEKAVADAKKVTTRLSAETFLADDAYVTATKNLNDARTAAYNAEELAKKAKDEAFKALEAAKAALEKAKEEEEDGGEGEDCVAEPKFTTVVNGLPSKVVGGTTVNFTMKVTNGTAKKMDEVYPYAFVHAFDTKGLKELDKYLDLEYYSGGSWKDADEETETEFGIGNVGPLKAKSSLTVKLRLKVDAKIPAGQGAAFVAGDYWNEDESCGGTPDLDYYEFEILAKGSDAGKVDDAKGKPGKPNGNTAQGGTSNTPVTTGTLAKTGSNDAVPQLAMAGAAAVALGAGAMFVARRRKAGADA